MVLRKIADKVTFHAEGEARLENPDITMDEFVGRLIAHGNKVISRNDEARTCIVMQANRTLLVGAPLDDEKPFKAIPCPTCSKTIRHFAGILPDVQDRKAAMDALETALKENGSTIEKRLDEAEVFLLKHSDGTLKDGTACAACQGQGHVVVGA